MRVQAERHAPSTKKTYAPYVKKFLIWNASLGRSEAQIHSDVTGRFFLQFLAAMASDCYATSTINVASSAILDQFRIPSWKTAPDYKDTKRGIARITASRPVQKHPFRSRWLRRLVRRTRHCNDDPTVITHITLLCVGFYACLRRSEITALNVGDIKISSSRVRGNVVVFAVIKIRRSKTDQTGKGCHQYLPATGRDCCPVFWLQRLLAIRPAAKQTHLFASDDGSRFSAASVAYVVKNTVMAVAPRHAHANYSGHSLRRGGLTALSLAGAPNILVQKIARHKDPRSTEKYIRPSLASLHDVYSSL
jgi:integrase